MDKITSLAEKILFLAAQDPSGHCYPSQVTNNKVELDEALSMLEVYGRTRVQTSGAMPIFTINDAGRTFVAFGAWSEREHQMELESKRHNEIIDLAKKNNKYQLLAIGVAIIICIIGTILNMCNRM